MDTRTFNLPMEGNIKKTQCKFFKTPQGCKNGNSCKFAHEDINWRESVELSPDEKIKDEVSKAIKYGKLSEIFNEMLTNGDDYIKYYNHVLMQFRGVACWKLQRKSIKNNLFDTFEKFNVPISKDEELPYGYMPFCLHFLFAGLAWKTFDGSNDTFGYREIESCIDEVIDALSSIYKNDYNNVLRMTAQYCNPKYGDNVAHTATYFLCDKIMYEFKNTLSPEDFKTMLQEKNNDGYNIQELYNIQKKDIEDLKKKYEYKYLNNLKRSKDRSDREKAKQIYEFNLEDLNRKIDYFEQQFFIEYERPKFKYNHHDYDKKFNEILSKLLKDENRFGIPYERGTLSELIEQIKMNFKENTDEKINLILSKIPDNLFNVNHLIEDFKQKGYIENLWNFTIKSINEKTPLSFCPSLLYEFFKTTDEPKGLHESYMGEYIKKLQSINKSLNKEDKIEFNKLLSNSKLEENIINQIIPW